MIPLRIGLVGFDGVVALDLAGPAEAFGCARLNGKPCYEVLTIAASNHHFVSESGIVFKPHRTFKNAPPLDTLIVPGGSGLRQPAINKAIGAFVTARAPRTRRIASICTGVFGLAPTGLLAGRNVTTHWAFADQLAARFPDLRVNDNAIFLKDGSFYTSAGATAGIDLTLALIEEDFGPRMALAVARDLVVYLKRAGGQEQYSEPLRFQMASVSRFSELTTWVLTHLHQDLSVEALAAKACLCPRHFSRRFKAEFGSTPADFVEKLRLDEARRRLSVGDNTVESVAASVGFKSPDTFRRAFERRLGVNPSEYRKRFNAVAPSPRPKSNRISLAA